jgi:hypothetical protein
MYQLPVDCLHDRNVWIYIYIYCGCVGRSPVILIGSPFRHLRHKATLDLRFSWRWKNTFFCAVTPCGLERDGGDMFLRNVGLSPNYTALQPRRQYSTKLHYTL